MKWLLLLALGAPAFAEERRPNLDNEQRAFDSLERKFDRFQENVNEVDIRFELLRNAVNSGAQALAEQIAAEITPWLKKARRQFAELDLLYNMSRRAKRNFARIRYREARSKNPAFSAFLTFRYNDRNNAGVPMELLLASWRGLQTGRKLETIPSSRLRTGQLDGQEIRSTDTLLIILTNGGLVRGRFEGIKNDHLFLREVFFIPLMHLTATEGKYRELDLKQAAHVVIVKKPRHISRQEAPYAVIDSSGEYSDYFARPDHVTRIDLQFSDLELYNLTKAGKFEQATFKPRSRAVDVLTEHRPPYTEIFYMDCNLFLRTP